MNKYFGLIIITFFLGVVLFLGSCSKRDSTHPAPSNLQLSGVVVTTVNSVTGTSLVENYSFSYDGNNRLSQEIYTTNDTTIFDLISYYTYTSTTVYKATYYQYTHNMYKKTDTFSLDQSNNIGTVQDSALVNNTYTFTWSSSSTNPEGLLATMTNNLNHISYTYKSHSGDILYCDEDSSGNIYTFDYLYTGYTNRIGDYLQLNSFLVYGYNFFQNEHMIKSISGIYGTTTASYLIDANNIVSQTNVVMTNGLGTVVMTQQYDLSYKSY